MFRLEGQNLKKGIFVLHINTSIEEKSAMVIFYNQTKKVLTVLVIWLCNIRTRKGIKI